MKQIKACFLVLALLAWGRVFALPVDHPANPEASVPAFRPADYFVSQPANVELAADEHQHDAAPAAQESGATDEAAEHAHDEGTGKGGSDQDDMMCMKKSGNADKKESGMMDCDMMKMMKEKGMRQDDGKATGEPETNKDEGHESHH